MINLNVASGSGRWVTGMNTILLPRAIALDCKLNYTLENLGSISSSHPLYGASFVYTNTTQAVSSAHVVVVISKNVTAAQAETLLYDLTHNSTNARIGNNVTISSTNYYLLHLPSDVLAGIPMTVANDGLGPGPNYLNLWQIIVSIINFVLEAAFFVLTFGIVLTFYLYDLGMKVLGAIESARAAIVKAAVDTLVNAWNAFVTWVIQFANDVFNTLIAGPVNDLWNAMQAWALGFFDTFSTGINDFASGKEPLLHVVSKLVDFLFGNTAFQLLMAVTTVILIAVSIIQPILAPFAFLMWIIAPLVIDLVLKGLLEVFDCGHTLIDALFSGMDEFINGAQAFLFSSGVSLSVAVIAVSTAFLDFIGNAFDVFKGFIKGPMDKLFSSIIGFGLSVLGLIHLSISNMIDQQFKGIFVFLGLVISGGGLWHSVKGMEGNFVSKFLVGVSVVGMCTSVYAVGEVLN